MQFIPARWFAALVLGITAQAAAAQAPSRSFAVVSEIGREIVVVNVQNTIGTRISPNHRTKLPVAEGTIDKLVLTTARTALKKPDPRTPVWLVAPLEADLFSSVPSEGGSVQLPQDLADAARQQGSTHLLLFSRLRADAHFQLSLGGGVGSGGGQLEGLGFYIDHSNRYRDINTGAEANGMMAPYLYARATLIELATGRVLRTRRIAEGILMANIRADAASTRPWDALTSEEKLRALSELITREVDRSVADVALR